MAGITLIAAASMAGSIPVEMAVGILIWTGVSICSV